jgi:histidinol-phosphatase (PHP family)
VSKSKPSKPKVKTAKPATQSTKKTAVSKKSTAKSSQPSLKKATPKPVPKNTPAKAKPPVKKASSATPKPSVTPARKTVPAPVKKAPPPVAKKAPAKKAPAKKIPIKKAPAPVAKKAPLVKKPTPPSASKAPAAPKVAVKTPANKGAPPAPEPKISTTLVVSSTGMPRIASLPSAPPPAPKSTTKKVFSLPSISSDPIAAAKAPVISSEAPVASKSGALFYDSHMHTPLCKHAWGEPEEYAAQAVKAGLKGIIFTCHCPMPDSFWPTVRMSESELDLYVDLVKRTAAAYKGKLEVLLGLESEYFPGYEKWLESLHQRANFDYVLGAVHWQSKEYLNKFEVGTIENFRRSYFENLALSAETGLYDCLAHPDLVKNYHPDSWCFAIIKNTVTTVLDRIAKTGVAMELNTSGLNKSYSEMNPGNEMLRMMAERKIPIVIGSDAHKPVRVGEHFVTALNNLSEAGFEHISYFKKRQRIDLKISDVISSIRRATDANA